MLEKLLMKIRIWTWTESQNLTTRVFMKQLLPVNFFPLLQQPPKSVKNLEHSHNLYMVGREELFFQAWRTKSTQYHVKLCFLAAACLTQPFAPNPFTHLLPWFWGFGFLQLLAWNTNAIQRMSWSEPDLTWKWEVCQNGNLMISMSVLEVWQDYNQAQMQVHTTLFPWKNLQLQQCAPSSTFSLQWRSVLEMLPAPIVMPEKWIVTYICQEEKMSSWSGQFFYWLLCTHSLTKVLLTSWRLSVPHAKFKTPCQSTKSFKQIPKTIFTADSWKKSFTADFWNNLLQQISEISLITFLSWTFFSLMSYELIGLPKLLL